MFEFYINCYVGCTYSNLPVQVMALGRLKTKESQRILLFKFFILYNSLLLLRLQALIEIINH